MNERNIFFIKLIFEIQYNNSQQQFIYPLVRILTGGRRSWDFLPCIVANYINISSGLASLINFSDPGLVWNSTRTACVQAGNVNNGNSNVGKGCSSDELALLAPCAFAVKPSP